jgi:hypothetical protein
MQAIQTKILPQTYTKPTRIKARCDRGSITVSWDSILGTSPEEKHRAAVKRLIAKFMSEDKKESRINPDKNVWNRPFVTGGLSNGTWAHVFTS